MGKVISISKWELESNTWQSITNGKVNKKALSIGILKTILNNSSEDINYIIFADSMRLENHTTYGSYISNSSGGVSNIIRYFKNKDENFEILLFLVDNDAPLVEESKFMAALVDGYTSMSTTKTVNVIGTSKCGTMAFDMMKYLKNPLSKNKTYVYSISSPYLGTPMASPLYFAYTIRKAIEAKLGKNLFSDKVIKSVIAIYNQMLSNSHIDLDIGIADGIPDNLKDKYDPNFLRNIFSETNLISLANVKHYENICTVINDETLRNGIKNGDLNTLGLCILNDCIFGGNSDGMVSLKSQKKIEDYYDDEHSSSKLITSSHGVFYIPIYANEVLDIVYSNLNKEKELQRSLKRL